MERNVIKSKDRRGLAILEAALVLPLFIFVVLAVCEYGYLFFKFQYVVNAARQGARVAALSGQTAGSGEAALLEVLSEGGLANDGSSVMPIDNNTKMKAIAQVTYDSVIDFPLLWTPEHLRSTAVMSKEP